MFLRQVWIGIPSNVTELFYFKSLPGASSALLGKEGAMACTVAVEESISEHYNSQIRALMEKDPERYTELLQVSQPLFSLQH